MGALNSAKSRINDFRDSTQKAMGQAANAMRGSPSLSKFSENLRKDNLKVLRDSSKTANQILQNRRAIAMGLIPDPSKSGKGGMNAAGLRYQSLGRFAQSLFIKGFGGGIVGGFVGILGFSAINGIMSGVGSAFRRLGNFLSDSLQEGMNLSRLETSLKFLAQSQPRAESWLQQMIELSSSSGFGINQVGSAFQIMAGQTTDLGQVPSIMRAITEISAGLGADAAKMQRFALAVGQVAAAGRFEGQEILQLTELLPIKHFAETAGISIGEFRNQMKEGTLSVDILWQTLNRLALSPGGAFFGKLADQSKTAFGQVMQVQQKWTLFKAQVGKGLLEELKDQGILSAMQQGLSFMMDNKDQVRGVLHEMIGGFKNLAIATARWAGVLFDTFLVIRANWSAFKFLLGQVLPPLGIAIQLTENVGMGLPGFRSGTGEKWAKAMTEAFDRDFVPKAQRSVGLIDIDAMAPKMSADVQNVFDKINNSIKEGITPLQQYRRQLDLIGQAELFHSNKYKKELEKRNRLLQYDPGLDKFLEMPVQGFTDEAGFGRAQEFLKLEKSLGIDRMVNELPQAMKRGSVEAQSAINKALMGESRQLSIQERIAKVLETANKKHDKEIEELREIARLLKPKAGPAHAAVIGFGVPGS